MSCTCLFRNLLETDQAQGAATHSLALTGSCNFDYFCGNIWRTSFCCTGLSSPMVKRDARSSAESLCVIIFLPFTSARRVGRSFPVAITSPYAAVDLEKQTSS